jgi:hypothetical protein
MTDLINVFVVSTIVAVVALVLEYWVIQPMRKDYEARMGSQVQSRESPHTEDAMNSRVKRLFAWALFGKADENLLASSLIELVRLLFAMVVWAIIGAAVMAPFVGLLTVTLVVMGSSVFGTNEAIIQWSILGAIGGAIFRGILWPIIIGVSSALRHRSNFGSQSSHVEQIAPKSEVTAQVGIPGGPAAESKSERLPQEDLLSLQRKLAEARENLRLIQERIVSLSSVANLR